MDITPAVSVMIPTHNCLRWLPSALASVGPRPDIEIIVFDDASTDGTADWLATAADADHRIVVMRGQGIGPSKARNRAIGVARAPLLAFLDADDIWYPGKLDLQIALHAARPEVAFSFTDYRHVTEDGQDRGSCFAYWRQFHGQCRRHAGAFLLGSNAMALLFAENVVGTSTVMARADAIRAMGCFSEDLPSAEDWDLWLRLAKTAPVLCIPQVMADYMIHRTGSVTSKLRARAISTRMIGARHQDAVRTMSSRAVRSFMSRVLEADAEIAMRMGEPWGSLGCRIAALAWSPSVRTAREALAAARDVLLPRRMLRLHGARATAGLV